MNIENRKGADGWLARWSLVLAGIVLGQAILFGPSLSGRKILLPLDILAQPGVYLPSTPETAGIAPHNMVLSDLVYQFEPARRFAVSELHQGRFPLWAPYQYGGVPFVWPKYSLFLLLECCTPSPVILAWVQLLAALVAGAGMYCFCRKSLAVSHWPAAVCAWCYPLTAFFILWQGFPTGLAVYWLPWLFLVVDKTIRGVNPLAAMGLSLVTFLTLTSGHIDVAGQALLGSGFYALWCWWDGHAGQWFGARARTALVMLALGWGLGFLLAAPHLLPLLEYAKTGSRMMQRRLGTEERPPVGLAALPQVVLPDIYGTTENGSCHIGTLNEHNLLESAAAGYTGVLATLLVAPLAWCRRSRYAANSFWVLLAAFGLSWLLNVPGVVHLLRLPGLNMMSHNRLVFLTSFAILALTATGLDNLWQGRVERKKWFLIPAVLLAALGGWCLFRSIVLPEPVATRFEAAILAGEKSPPIPTIGEVHQIQAWFIRHYTIMAESCVLGFIGWLLVWYQKLRRFFPVLLLLLPADLLWFDCGRSSQCDPALYYPRLPVLAEVARSAPGRVIGGLPAPLPIMQGLPDVRGYDSIDPSHMVELLLRAAVPGREGSYAATLFMLPNGTISPPGTVRLPPILDLLNVRYVIFRGMPPPNVHPPYQSNDYWILVNSNALPRVFVPQSVQTLTNEHLELETLASPRFNPAAVAYVESVVDLPSTCRGTARIIHETPTHVMVSAQMDTAGLVVLADNWDKGWRASWNGRALPVLRTDYAVRGVVVPAGTGTLEFVYRPTSLLLGWWLAGGAVLVLVSGWFTVWIRRFKTGTPAGDLRGGPAAEPDGNKHPVHSIDLPRPG